MRQPRVAAVGSASWDRLLVVERYPAPGTYAMVRAEVELPGGTTTNSAVALARLGAAVTLAAMVGDDAPGEAIRASLAADGVDARWLTRRAGARTDAATVIVSLDPPERTLYWHVGARLGPDAPLDLDAVF